MKDIYIRKSDAEMAVRIFCKACIEKDRGDIETTELAAEIIRVLNSVPQISINSEIAVQNIEA